MLRRRVQALALLLASLLTYGAAAPAAAAPAAPHDILSGRWLVNQTCLTLCTGHRGFTEIVHHRAGSVYVGTGGEAQTLYQLGSQVLIHAPGNAVLLTIRRPRQLMTGQGITTDGATLNVTWRCVAPARASAGGSGAAPSGISAAKSGVAPAAVEVC